VSDSTLARRFTFTTVAGASTPADPAVRALQERKQELEAQVAALRERKSRMDSTAYERELETLLRELAGVTQELRRKQP
jgi:anion-transporting  ArsA/GET3 family ATPase